MGQTIPLSLVVPVLYGCYGTMAYLHKLYLSWFCVLSDPSLSVLAALREIPESIETRESSTTIE